jgi:putative transposase
MAKKKRHGAAEIAAKLLAADALAAKGQTQAEIAKALGISVMTIHRWRKMREREFPRSRAEAVRVLEQPVVGNRTYETGALSRIAQLELENARLRKLVTDLLLDKMRLEDGQARPGLSGRKGKSANKRGSFQA